MPAARNLTGQTLHGTYAIGRVVGEGGFGLIYEATHLRLNRKLAVKVLSADKSVRPEGVQRFWREAEVMSRLGHPHIVEVVDVNQTEEGTPYIVMEFLVGETLAQRLEREKTLGLAEASAVLEQVGSALDAVHAEGIIHRDLKPGNIILCQGGSAEPWVKVIDFGLSRLLAAPTFLTGPGGIILLIFRRSWAIFSRLDLL